MELRNEQSANDVFITTKTKDDKGLKKMNEREFLEEDLFLEDNFEPLTVEEEKELAEHLREYRENPFYLGDELFFINDDEDDLFIL